MTNYNDSREPKTNKHQTELLLALEAQKWEYFNGDGRSDNHKRTHKITMNPMGLGYLSLLDSEIASYDNIPSDVKLILIDYLSFYFDRLITWQGQKRGRKIGIFGNMSLGYIMATQAYKGGININFYRKLYGENEEAVYLFRIDANGQGFESFNGYIFVRENGAIYQINDDRINDLEVENAIV